MKRPPRAASARLFDRRVLTMGVIQGTIALILLSIVFLISNMRGTEPDATRATVFVTMVLLSIVLIFADRSWSRSGFANLRIPNPALWWISSGALACLLAILTVPFLRRLFLFAQLSLIDIATCAVTAGGALLLFEVSKTLYRRYDESAFDARMPIVDSLLTRAGGADRAT